MRSLITPRTCQCETSYCDHALSPCTRAAGETRMQYVGNICDTCAQHVIGNGGASFLTLSPDHEHATPIGPPLLCPVGIFEAADGTLHPSYPYGESVNA